MELKKNAMVWIFIKKIRIFYLIFKWTVLNNFYYYNKLNAIQFNSMWLATK